MINCPECRDEVRSMEFYDHMLEYHQWTMIEAERYADNWYQENISGIKQ